MALEIIKNNSSVLSRLEPGDLVEFTLRDYSHWAVYKGDKKVIHLVGEDGDGSIGVNSQRSFLIGGKMFAKASIRMDNFWMVAAAGGYTAHKNNRLDTTTRTFSKDKIISRAMSKIGLVTDIAMFRECEYFATWCRYKAKVLQHSYQTTKGTTRDSNPVLTSLEPGDLTTTAQRPVSSGTLRQIANYEKKNWPEVQARLFSTRNPAASTSNPTASTACLPRTKVEQIPDFSYWELAAVGVAAAVAYVVFNAVFY